MRKIGKQRTHEFPFVGGNCLISSKVPFFSLKCQHVLITRDFSPKCQELEFLGGFYLMGLCLRSLSSVFFLCVLAAVLAADSCVKLIPVQALPVFLGFF